MEISIVLAVVMAVVGLTIISRGFKIVQQSECMIVERLGSYSRTMKSGFHIVVPFIEQTLDVYWVHNGQMVLDNRIDLRETVLDVPEQTVITKDNVSINIDALLYIQITDPVKASYEIANLPMAVGQLAQTSLRNVIGEMDLDETLASRDVINTKLKTILDEATDKWGTKVNRVELKNITPPKEIQLAMEKQMQAERERRAQVLEAEGDKQALIARSEGKRQENINFADGEREAAIRRAQGEAQAIIEVAEAEREAIEKIKSALGTSDLTAQYLIASTYLEKFGQFTQKGGDKVFIPYEASTALGTLGSISELVSGGRIFSGNGGSPNTKMSRTVNPQ
ncbi:MAG: SPFH/Band 7/PHB domain protein [Bdellovibrionaceae bacterium]|nr:SPFH/Band 7/PHB domain protein [Bdellovibrionales bacterium]MCB9083850.1 SPFH/Band 7/PHB domain protein [Pseudobdellovibrionaceae bacterium]